MAVFSYNLRTVERLSGKQVLFLLVGFFGILLIFQPEATGQWFNHATGIVYAMGTALGYLAIKEAQKYYDSRWVVVSFMGAGLIASVISLCLGTFGDMPNSFFTGKWVMPTSIEWIQALIMGLLALGVQYFTTQALLHERTSIVGAVGNSAVVFSIAIEIALGHGIPTLLVCLGMVL